MYRLLLRDPAGELLAVMVIQCNDDQAAMQRSTELSDGRAFELWYGAHLVTRGETRVD